MTSSFQHAAILGTGLVGGSLALALKELRTPPRVLGFDLNADSRRGAQQLKTTAGIRAFDGMVGNLTEAVQGADLVVLATPVRAMELLLRELALLAAPGTLITDTGGTKQQVLSWAEAVLPETLPFVGGSPLVFKVESGPLEVDAKLFDRSLYCLCPLARTPQNAVEALVKLVEALGAIPHFLDASEHDGLMAAVSTLPQLTAAAVVNSTVGSRIWREAATMAGGAFATAAHLAQADSDVLADVCLTNREALAWQLDQMIEELRGLKDVIVAGDESLRGQLDRARQRHREWLNGRATVGDEERPPVDTTGLKAENMFLPSKLTGLFRGRGKSTDA
jgi:prephenate dehydrogenase